LEMIIAAGIIVSSVVTVIALGIVTVRGGRESEYRIVGANLAREGIEYFRNIRDSNWLQGNLWNAGITNGAYKIEFNGSGWTSAACPNIEDEGCRLYINTSGIYNFSDNTGTPTQFYRQVTVSDWPPAKKIRSEVLWKEKGGTRNIIIDEDLTEWR